jgi:hypothetical protein
MERRYLVAALAIIATFAVFSRGFHALQRMSVGHSESYETVAAARCWANSAAQTVAKVRGHFHRGYSPEQAQMVAEMNMPGMESSIAEQMARQDHAIARCARQRAMQQAERTQRQIMQQAEHAQREAMRMQKQYAHVYAIPASASAYAASMPPDLGERIEKSLSEAQQQLEASQESFSTVQIPSVEVDTQDSTIVVPNTKCKVKIPKQAIRAFQYGFTSR